MANVSVYTKINQNLTWKRVIAFNILLLLLIVVPLSVRLAQQDTENRSSAAGNITPSPTPLPNYPTNPPTIDRVTLFYGKPGDTVVLLGNNFGDYKWGSSLYVGNIEVKDEDIVRWSNEVVEAQIPSDARTGGVWISVNSRTDRWDGSLLLYDQASSSMVGMTNLGSSRAVVWVEKGERVARGMIQFGYEIGQLNVNSQSGIQIINQVSSSDRYGNVLTVDFNVDYPLQRSRTQILDLVKSVGAVELLRVELYDSQGNLISVYSDPLRVMVSF